MNDHKPTKSFFAHTGEKSTGCDWQLLHEHLKAVGAGARRLTESFADFDSTRRLEKEVQIAGWLHDLGKYRPEFQAYLFGFPVEKEKRYHKQAGAAKAALLGYEAVAFAIAGHHGGMPSLPGLKQAVITPSGKEVCDAVWKIAVSENPELGLLTPNPHRTKNTLEIEFYARLILSCLVDADWSDSAKFQRQVRGLTSPGDVEQLTFESLDRFLDQLLAFTKTKAFGCKDETIRQIRSDILQDCLDRASGNRGVYSLTVPTGGGKTLSSFAFALKHAIQNKMRRIIYVAPYLSIIDQNTQVLRDALGLSNRDQRLFAHHSLAEPPEAGDQEMDRDSATRLAENWNAPFIVTTNVQFYESLFANKPSKVRKLHNIASSVVILDECQSLPPGMILPTCAMLRQASETLGCTIVLCTATQPVFDHGNIPESHRVHATEIIHRERDLFSRLKRVNLHWPQTRDDTKSWDQVADSMLEEKAALCIVNTRRAARELIETLQARSVQDVFHLSTNMCPVHRMSVLKQVRRQLQEKRTCYLVATQLIEAGVDVDFPVVLREMAPLEAIIQAAGRCNREGRMKTGGNTIVFRSQAAIVDPQKYYPPDQWYKAGRSTLEASFLAVGNPPSIDRAEDIREYFCRLYELGKLDANDIHQARVNLDFPYVADNYRLIEDDSVSIAIGSWEKQRDRVERIVRRIGTNPTRSNFRKLAPFQVNIRRQQMAGELGKCISRPFPHLELLVWYGPYSDTLGMNSISTDQLMIV